MNTSYELSNGSVYLPKILRLGNSDDEECSNFELQVYIYIYIICILLEIN